MSHLDPLREHRWFCPWKNGAVQHSGPGSGTSGTGVTTGTAVTQGPETSSERAAWEVLVAVLKGDAYLRGLEHQHRRHGRTKSSVQQSSGPSSTSSTVNAAGSLDAAATEGGGTPGTQPPEYRFDEVAADDDAAARELRDKERWARLRKVKSLFDTKGGRKIMRKNGSSSRPGTSGTLAPPSGGPTEPGTPASTVPDTPRTLGGGE